jgi:O-antigen ligase
MRSSLPLERWSWQVLLFFAATAAFSIVWQHSIWVAVLLWLLAWAKGRVKPLWPQGPFALATLLFMASFFTGALFGVDPANSFGTVHKVLTYLLFFLIGAMGLGRDQVKKLLFFFVVGASFCGIWGIYQHLFLGKARMASFGGHIMTFGGILMTALLLEAYFLHQEPKKVRHWAVTGILGLTLLFNKTRGAWLGFGAGLFGLLGTFRRRWVLPALGIAVASYFLLPSAYQLRVKSIWDPTIRHTNIERLLMWKSGWAISQDHPLFGIGHDNIGDIYPTYRLQGTRDGSIAHLHNNFVQVLVQNGWTGLLAYLGWIGTYLWTALRKRRWPKGTEELNLLLTWVFVAGLIWGLTEWTFSHQYMNLQAFLLGLQANLWRQGKAS